MSEGSQSSGEGQRRRRRRRSAAKAKPQTIGLTDVVRSGAFGWALLGITVLIALGLVWTSWRQVDAARSRYGEIAIGMDGPTVQGLLGSPQAEADREWQFRESGRTLRIAFGANGKVAMISCREQDLTALACPDFLGVRIGDGAAKITDLLGQDDGSPEDRRTQLAYSALGVRFALDQEKVATITVARHDRAASPWPVILSRVLP